MLHEIDIIRNTCTGGQLKESGENVLTRKHIQRRVSEKVQKILMENSPSATRLSIDRSPAK